ncbi:MAG: hypothetical protein ACK4GR_05205 [bacterium]
MVNAKYKILNEKTKDIIFENIERMLKSEKSKEKKYEQDGNICLYKIDDYLGDSQKFFIISFYFEKTKYYDFSQSFLSKLIFVDNEVIYIMSKVGYVFVTDLFVKSFSKFWEETFGKVFTPDYVELMYKNF